MHAEDSAGSEQYTFFDRLERPVGSDASLGGGLRSREQIEYRADGLVDRQRDAKGQEVDLHYDAAGRLEKRTEEQGQTETDWAYYAAGTGQAGRLQSVATTPSGLGESYTYSSTHGLPTEVTRTIGTDKRRGWRLRACVSAHDSCRGSQVSDFLSDCAM